MSFLEGLGYTKRGARYHIEQVTKELNSILEKDKQKLVNQNILILQTIVRECLDSSLPRYKDAISAISEMNKIMHAYDIKTEVNIHNNYGFEFGIPDSQVVETNVEVEEIDVDEQ